MNDQLPAPASVANTVSNSFVNYSGQLQQTNSTSFQLLKDVGSSSLFFQLEWTSSVFPNTQYTANTIWLFVIFQQEMLYSWISTPPTRSAPVSAISEIDTVLSWIPLYRSWIFSTSLGSSLSSEAMFECVCGIGASWTYPPSICSTRLRSASSSGYGNTPSQVKNRNATLHHRLQ